MKNIFSVDTESIKGLLNTSIELNHVNDLDSLLDKILFEARKFSNADAGSIFLKHAENLLFSYVQNGTLSKKDETHNRFIYSKLSIPVNEKSIAGYVAKSRQPLLIDDVYTLDSSAPYCFNSDFDKMSNYHTKSLLVIPIISSREEIIGVIELINAKDENNNTVSFTDSDKLYASYFANNVSVAIERAQMTREMVLRMIKMAELRDPKETGSHVNRVGSYAIEIYEKWAKKSRIEDHIRKKFKDNLRIASMLHDVGKIAIPDTILKKPAKLTNEEYKTMKTHSYQGSILFEHAFSELDLLCGEVAHTHHERWDGKGYPQGLKETEIPLSGRITCVADVYDALVSKRVYKDAWDESEVVNYLKENAGTQFDPEIIDCFISIYDVIKAIREKYQD